MERAVEHAVHAIGVVDEPVGHVVGVVVDGEDAVQWLQARLDRRLCRGGERHPPGGPAAGVWDGGGEQETAAVGEVSGRGADQLGPPPHDRVPGVLGVGGQGGDGDDHHLPTRRLRTAVAVGRCGVSAGGQGLVAAAEVGRGDGEHGVVAGVEDQVAAAGVDGQQPGGERVGQLRCSPRPWRVRPGAARGRVSPERFRVLLDPAGHPFCLVR